MDGELHLDAKFVSDSDMLYVYINFLNPKFAADYLFGGKNFNLFNDKLRSECKKLFGACRIIMVSSKMDSSTGLTLPANVILTKKCKSHLRGK